MGKEANAIGFVREIVALIRVDREAEARERFNLEYLDRYNQLSENNQQPGLKLLLFQLDEYLNDPEAVRMGAVSKDLIESELHDIEKAARNRQ